MNKTEPILIACEESGIVTEEFIKLGFTNVFSCDLMETSGNYPDHHICGDVIPLINGNCCFTTSDGVDHEIKTRFSLIIAFPPCTYLTVTGNSWFNVEKYGEKAIQRMKDREKAAEFFKRFANADCDKIAIENPVGVMSSRHRKPDQIIQPYMFGETERKTTCLWLKGLPKLQPTEIVEPILYTYKDGRTDCNWHMKTIGLPPKQRSRERSKTFPGIAKAMATQWSNV